MRPTQERLKELFEYDPETGFFFWRTKGSNRRVGAPAGSSRLRYKVIFIDGKNYRAHQCAWLYMIGEWPPQFIDHRDLNKHNNAWSNLRLATTSQNFANRSLPKTNKSGLKGASRDSRGNAWRAQIKKDHKTIYLGLFATKEEAHAAYLVAAKKLYGEFARAA